MDKKKMEDLLSEDGVAKQWIKEIDSFKSPPPPRRLADLNGLEGRGGGKGKPGITTTPGSSTATAIHSRDGSCSNNSSSEIAGGGETTQQHNGGGNSNNIGAGEDDGSNLPPDNFIVEKVRQFEDNDAHPYANHRRIETTKKIAAQGGGNLAAFLINSSSNDKSNNKQRISKEEATKLRAAVLQENRVYNPYPAPYTSSTTTSSASSDNGIANGGNGAGNGIGIGNGTSSSSARRKDPSNSSGSSACSGASSGIVSPRRQLLPPPNNHHQAKIVVASTNNIRNHQTKIIAAASPAETTTTKIPPPKQQQQQLSRSDSAEEDDEEMQKLYRTFDAELQRVGLGTNKERENFMVQENRPTPQPPPVPPPPPPPPQPLQSSMPPRLPPYTGIRQQQQQSVVAVNKLPPLPARQQHSDWSQRHYDVPAGQQLLAGKQQHQSMVTNVTAPVPPAASENGLGLSSVVSNGGIPPAPPPPPPPPVPPVPVSYTRRRQDATPIVDRIPPPPKSRSVSHAAVETWRNEQRKVASVGPDEETERKNVASLERRSSADAAGTRGESGRQKQQVVIHQINHDHPMINRVPQPQPPPQSTAAVVERQRRMWDDFEKQVAEDLEQKAVPIGLCYQCGSKVTDPFDTTQALGNLYHAQCFTCFYCGRPLKGKKFYEARGKVYCEEDYLYAGFQHSVERCAACGHLIMDMILQAVGKSFHPSCFKCHECRRGLENVPYTVDDRGLVYCIDDYHRLFAPRCAKCRQPITPIEGRKETVRVVAMQRDYHIDCYACEGCGLRLTDEDEKRCYPLGDHLLCQRCHVYWSRTGGAAQTITDV